MFRQSLKKVQTLIYQGGGMVKGMF